jgi:hypothetical protein
VGYAPPPSVDHFVVWPQELHVALSNYRRPFWRAAWHALSRGQIDAALGMGLVAYHLIRFSREALRGEQNASFYSARGRAAVTYTLEAVPALGNQP